MKCIRNGVLYDQQTIQFYTLILNLSCNKSRKISRKRILLLLKSANKCILISSDNLANENRSGFFNTLKCAEMEISTSSNFFDIAGNRGS